MAKSTHKSSKKSNKEQQNTGLYITLGLIGIAILAVIYLVVSNQNSPAKVIGLMGDVIPITSSAHVPDTSIPGPYSSNPPAGGTHFEEDYTEKFYQESDLSTLGPHPEGHLVHSLEHGYVIFWYNCNFPNTDCSSLKQTIQQVMDETGKTKLIAFPWSDLQYPLAMTSWGRLMNFKTADAVVMKQFVEHNRYHAPEPDAP